ncbi:hypothetical protein KEM48_000558 [Puccinia striiformis f. sp. tritici PST-130]|nr:hypothetical protein KEM48_000558 [Puccinia striiformis f. sp. tritici PST-130]KAI9600918.1 hypothetical protein H4Q26_000712 [Puccinia striiformis f. sp. tritici PST-130]
MVNLGFVFLLISYNTRLLNPCDVIKILPKTNYNGDTNKRRLLVRMNWGNSWLSELAQTEYKLVQKDY